MRIAVVTNDLLKTELLAQGITNDVTLEWFTDPAGIGSADYCLDLLFDGSQTRIDQLLTLTATLVIVHAITDPGKVIPSSFVRLNAWPTFLQRPLAEISVADSSFREKAEQLFAVFNRTVEWVPVLDGFITPRVISMVINEAYFALQEEVSSKHEIDIAMKLGTNYPFGPFEWVEKIGKHNVYSLLEQLAKTEERYQPSDLLKEEAVTA